MPERHVRVVGPDEELPQPTEPISLSEAVEIGDYLGILRAQRRDIVSSLPEEKGPAKAALHRQLALISKEIQAIEAKAAQEAEEGAGSGVINDETWDAEAL